jgi:hypothetical protein
MKPTNLQELPYLRRSFEETGPKPTCCADDQRLLAIKGSKRICNDANKRIEKPILVAAAVQMEAVGVSQLFNVRECAEGLIGIFLKYIVKCYVLVR